jgi:hypothetical protein
MKNSLGNPARGDAFYNRDKELRKIYRVLNTRASIYLSAPRRVGKTSILKHLEEFPENQFCFAYVITESTDDSNEFFKKIFEELLYSNSIKASAKYGAIVKTILSNTLNRITNINGVEFREGKEANYFELLVELFSKVPFEIEHVVVMVDEFPQTIQNILEKSGEEEAKKFLQKNRELRHHKEIQGKLSFIYTGSISLFPMIEKVTSLTSINDVRTVEIAPLTLEEAEEFLSLLMEEYNISLKPEIMAFVLKKVRYLIPFHLQLIQQEIIDVNETEEREISIETVERAFQQVVHIRNKPQFEPYFARLKKLFKGNDYDFVNEILQFVALKDFIDKATLNDFSKKHKISDWKLILDDLAADGYLTIVSEKYIYNSPILQEWCKKHICKS